MNSVYIRSMWIGGDLYQWDGPIILPLLLNKVIIMYHYSWEKELIDQIGKEKNEINRCESTEKQEYFSGEFDYIQW